MVSITTTDELISARRLVKDWATRLGYTTLECTKLVTAASELGRNLLVHAGGGTMSIAEVMKAAQPGLRLEFADQGPGIADVGLAMTDGFSTARSLGLGLGGARRLVSEFEMVSLPAQGTKVMVTQWKRR